MKLVDASESSEVMTRSKSWALPGLFPNPPENPPRGLKFIRQHWRIIITHMGTLRQKWLDKTSNILTN
eukprot:2540691-Amphidinium_carterae.1